LHNLGFPPGGNSQQLVKEDRLENEIKTIWGVILGYGWTLKGQELEGFYSFHLIADKAGGI